MQRTNYWAGRSLYRTRAKDGGRAKTVFEERVVVVQAVSEAGAALKLRREAIRYAKFLQQGGKYARLLRLLTIYSIQEETLTEGAEVWSVLRETPVPENQYLKHYHHCERESFLVFPMSVRQPKRVVRSTRSGR